MMGAMTPQEEAELAFAVLRGVPEIGDTFKYAFTYRDGHRDKPEQWRVSCYLKRYERPPMAERVAKFPEHIREDMAGMLARLDAKHPLAGHGPDSVPLVFCRREEAEYVEGVGVCGVIVRVSDVHVTGRVPWSDEMLADARHSAELLIGEVVR